MARHRHLAETLTKLYSSSLSLHLNPNPSKSLLLSLSSRSRFLFHRTFHTKSHLADSDSVPSSVADSDPKLTEIEEIEVIGIEDEIHRIIVSHAAPDWLPFLPGSSYWVPPKRRADRNDFTKFFGRFVDPLTEEESLSLVSSRGWPCSSVFLQGPEHSIPVEVEVEVEVEVQVKVQASPEKTSSDNED